MEELWRGGVCGFVHGIELSHEFHGQEAILSGLAGGWHAHVVVKCNDYLSNWFQSGETRFLGLSV
jgi:hypothetical protein